MNRKLSITLPSLFLATITSFTFMSATSALSQSGVNVVTFLGAVGGVCGGKSGEQIATSGDNISLKTAEVTVDPGTGSVIIKKDGVLIAETSGDGSAAYYECVKNLTENLGGVFSAPSKGEMNSSELNLFLESISPTSNFSAFDQTLGSATNILEGNGIYFDTPGVNPVDGSLYKLIVYQTQRNGIAVFESRGRYKGVGVSAKETGDNLRIPMLNLGYSFDDGHQAVFTHLNDITLELLSQASCLADYSDEYPDVSPYITARNVSYVSGGCKFGSPGGGATFYFVYEGVPWKSCDDTNIWAVTVEDILRNCTMSELRESTSRPSGVYVAWGDILEPEEIDELFPDLIQYESYEYTQISTEPVFMFLEFFRYQ